VNSPGIEFGGVDDHLRRAVLHRRQNPARAGDNDVAAEDEVGGGRRRRGWHEWRPEFSAMRM